MPNSWATVAAGLDDEDPGVASGEVFMDPQTQQREDESLNTNTNLAVQSALQQSITSPSYKAKLIFQGQTSPIGQFKGTGARVGCRIHLDENQHWSSCVRLEIKAYITKPSPTTEHTREEEYIHTWVIRLNATGDIGDDVTIWRLPKSVKDAANYIEQAYANYVINLNDKGGIAHRNAGNLACFGLRFHPAKAHTEGILHNTKILDQFQCVQDQLFHIFGQPNNNPLEMTAFFCTSETEAFYISYRAILVAFAHDRAFPPYTHWFNGSADAKCKIQKGQVTPREDRPPVTLPFCNTYANSDECWTTEGMSIIYREENDLQDIKDSLCRECQLRVMRLEFGADRMYMGLLRLPSNFEYRFSSEDSFIINIGAEEWAATILPRPFPYASSIDYTITLNRPFEDNAWSGLELKSVFDLTNSADILRQDIESFCFNGKATIVTVRPVLSDVPSKLRLAAIKTLNPAHEGDKNHVHNSRWQRLILGQDLRIDKVYNLFQGIDVKGNLTLWDIKLDESQMGALEYLARMPNYLGLIKGPWGTGKTKLDVVITLLLMSADRKVKVVSPTNKAADTFITKLKAELARLKEAGITISDKHVVRFHSSTTERTVVQEENQRFVTRDTVQHWRWQPTSVLPQSIYDRVATTMVNQAKERPWGVSDHRYILHNASFGTLLLQIADVLVRPDPNTNLAPNKNISDASGPQDDNTAEASGSHNGNSKEGLEDNPKNDSVHSDEYEPGVGPVWDGATSQKAMEFQQVVKENTQRKLAEAGGLTYREKLCICFREMFFEAEMGIYVDDIKGSSTFRALERLLSEDILTNDVAVVSTTIVNSGSTIIKEFFKGDHVIVQEAGRAENGDLFIALAGCENSVHLSGDDEQLPPQGQEVARNPFAVQTNKSLYKRLVGLDYPRHDLTQQHRTIPAICDIISKIWYKGFVVSTVDEADRPNTTAAIGAHQELFGRTSPIVFVSTAGVSNRMGFSSSSQNERELQVAIKLCQQYIAQGIKAKDILILAGYIAQVNLTKRALALRSELHGVDAGTIDGYLGEEKSVVILCIVGSTKLGFMSFNPRLLTGVSRAGDALAIITNRHSGILISEHKRKRYSYDHLYHLIVEQGGYAQYDAELPALGFGLHDHDIELDNGEDDIGGVQDVEAGGNDTGTLPDANATEGHGDAGGTGQGSGNTNTNQ